VGSLLDRKNHEKTMEHPFSHGFPIGFSWILGGKNPWKNHGESYPPAGFRHSLRHMFNSMGLGTVETGQRKGSECFENIKKHRKNKDYTNIIYISSNI